MTTPETSVRTPVEHDNPLDKALDSSFDRAPAGPRRLLFGLRLDGLTLAEVAQRCGDAMRERERLLIGVVNAAKVVNLRRDPLLRESLLEADVLLADGQSVVWASRLLRRGLPERVAGIDLFEQLLALGDREGRGVYLLGARSEVLRELVTRIEARFPGLRVVGSRDGYFSAAESGAVAAEIAASGADMLFLGMTSPHKEVFLATHGPSLGVSVLHGVGGSFDVLAGRTRRAPRAWQRLGLEWAYRLVQEPRRLWKRYLVTNTRFVALVARELVRPSAPLRHTAPALERRGNDVHG
ncbi:WecB/TagA/CpsF family glycosyltransferase [Cellulomonas cellasea]|uniref:WecB/TagA/CpsF family glycosyltransferase n=1 Tax=Cellulomonas cellasea TaxID=43670 RepID=UPI0025A485A5|nr:WecB/TagA/CpsF family glycosyltransferase [Cellulomonas cellasea]MDM8083224.1 WecB/TagA/CpsF family glycosyltransferase [Cellulomonas cellasea]